MTDILLILLLLMSIVLWLRKEKNKKLGVRSEKNENFSESSKLPTSNFSLLTFNVWWLIAGLELFVFISIFVAPDKLLALYGYGRFLLGVGFFWLIISAAYDRIKLVYAFLAGAVIQAGLGLWQFLTQSSFSSKWLGMAAHEPAVLGTSVVETLTGDPSTALGAGRWLRAYGGLDHPNMLGGLLVIGLLLTIGLIIINNKIGHKKFEIRNLKFKNSNHKSQIINYKFLILFTVYCLLFTALFFTFSRGAWAGLLAGLVVILMLLWRQKNSKQLKRILAIIAATTVLSTVLFGIYSDLLLTRLSQDTRLEIKSNTERWASYQQAIDIIQDNWILGSGINNYTLAKHNQIDSTQPSWYYQPVHNTYLLVYAEIGVFGFTCFVSLLLFTVYCLLFTKNGFKKNKFELIKIGPLISLFVVLMADHYFWSLHFGILFFWFTIGLIYTFKTSELD